MAAKPVIAKRTQSGQRFPVLLASGGHLAGDNVVGMADGESLDVHVASEMTGASRPGNLRTINLHAILEAIPLGRDRGLART